MKIHMKLRVESKHDLKMLLERAVSACGQEMPEQLVTAYKKWIKEIVAAYGEFSCPCFGHNDFDQINELISYQLESSKGDNSRASATIALSAAVLKTFRDYFAFAMVMMPLGTSVYWKPSSNPGLNLVITDERAPKGFLKLV